MVDQNRLDYQTPVESSGEVQPAPTVPPLPEDAFPSQLSPSPPPPSPVSPTVVVSGEGGGVPRWFYFIFGATVLVFFTVTTLLVLSLIQKPTSSPTTNPPTSVPTKSEKGLPQASPTTSPAGATTDSAVVELNTLSSSDEVGDLESDIDKTNLSVLDLGLTNLDSQIGFTPAPESSGL